MVLNVMDSGVFDLVNAAAVFFPNLMLSVASFGICLLAKTLVCHQVCMRSHDLLPFDGTRL